MNELRQRIEKIQPSLPIFKFTVHNYSRYDSCSFVKTGGNVDDSIDKSDIFWNLLIDNVSEKFDSEKLCFNLDTDNTYYRALNSLETAIMKFIRRYLSQKRKVRRVRSTALYKWYNYNLSPLLRKDNDLTEKFLALYKYLKETDTSDAVTEPHAKNIITILENVKSKYER